MSIEKTILKRNKIILILLAFAILESCAPTKNATYVRVNKGIKDISAAEQIYTISQDSIYVIKPGDELYITVSTSDNAGNSFTTETGMSDVNMLSYMVDKEGFVKLPYLDKMKISGLTLSSACEIMESELSQYLYQPIVTMKLVNTRITVLGEVNSPGMYMVHNKPVNIFQALALAGDISSFGNRKKVLILREKENQVVKKYVDLTDDSIIGSDWYSLNPNDIIIVSPMFRKTFGFETVPWELVSSVVSTTILIMTFMITLSN